MRLRSTMFGEVYDFGSIKEVLAKANEPKSCLLYTSRCV